jgi:hypothetical protein
MFQVNLNINNNHMQLGLSKCICKVWAPVKDKTMPMKLNPIAKT